MLEVDAEKVMWANLTARAAAATDRSQLHVSYRGAGDSAINHVFWDAPINRLYFGQWTARTQAPLAGGDASTVFSI